MIARRGAVLVESALIIPVLLLLTYGSIQLGIVGVQQLTADGGAFIATHQGANSSTDGTKYKDPVTLAKQALPILSGSSTTTVYEPTAGQPPNTDAPSATQYNLANANARHGGVSMILPTQSVGFVQNNAFTSLLASVGANISVTGVAIDPAFKLINGHGDVAGAAYNTAAAFATATDPFINGNNAPPYFVGYRYMTYCPAGQIVPNLSNVPVTCTGQHEIGLGLAEYLDVDNWGRPVNGVVPDGQAVFWETRLHQNQFAQIAQQLAAATTTTQLRAVLSPTNLPVACVYSFDNLALGSYSVGTTTIGTYPLTPGGNPAVCK